METVRIIQSATTGHAPLTRAASQTISRLALKRMLSIPGDPLFLADWLRTVMIHFEVDPRALQRVVPFEIDLRNGHAFVSTVAFTLSGMRPRLCGRIGAWLMKPIATHDFLNVRTYVRVNGEPGIYFLAEWLSNRLSVLLGPRAFGLPYRYGEIKYNHQWKYSAVNPARLRGHVSDIKTRNTFGYKATLLSEPESRECEHSSLMEWLMERYTAFTQISVRRRFFRVWHQPWTNVPIDISVSNKSLLEANWTLFRDAHIVDGNFSPGVTNVWMGWPHHLRD